MGEGVSSKALSYQPVEGAHDGDEGGVGLCGRGRGFCATTGRFVVSCPAKLRAESATGGGLLCAAVGPRRGRWASLGRPKMELLGHRSHRALRDIFAWDDPVGFKDGFVG